MRNVLFFCSYDLINGTQVFIITFGLAMANRGKRRLTKVGKFNDIGIDSELDWDRITHLFKLGIIAALMVLAGDMILGWGVTDETLTGMDAYFSRYTTVSDTRVFASAILGLIGIPLECLSYFGVYRLMAKKAPGYAHTYRSGLIGMLSFGAFTHVMCCATIYYLNTVKSIDSSLATTQAIQFAKLFLLPVSGIFLVFFLVAAITQIVAFAKELTPYPKWCWVFSMLSGIVVIVIMRFAGNHPLAYAVSTAWISIGALWTFGGLLVMSRKGRD